eukprot:TRINITY_DN614_c0_g1_i10.p1 TRINITY_DN614_c0_g1~~TRINITY_DN614_c0_g1_i10.p1  ORF type:complete len:156 (-),score=23.25 TRINITY_DN614_c0_g1_i10:315-782(-)
MWNQVFFLVLIIIFSFYFFLFSFFRPPFPPFNPTFISNLQIKSKSLAVFVHKKKKKKKKKKKVKKNIREYIYIDQIYDNKITRKFILQPNIFVVQTVFIKPQISQNLTNLNQNTENRTQRNLQFQQETVQKFNIKKNICKIDKLIKKSIYLYFSK